MRTINTSCNKRKSRFIIKPLLFISCPDFGKTINYFAHEQSASVTVRKHREIDEETQFPKTVVRQLIELNKQLDMIELLIDLRRLKVSLQVEKKTTFCNCIVL